MSMVTLLFSFRGRINRMPYWMVSLAMLGAAAVAVAMLLGFEDIGLTAALLLMVLLAFAWASLALAVKRLHDRDKSAWWLLVFYLLPPILEGTGGMAGGIGIGFLLASFALSIWALIELGFLRGTSGPNAYGADPLAGG